jgi:LPXTG-site transpeptidase (sortase) family protein
VVPVENIIDQEVRNNFIIGNPSGYEPYLEYGTLYYPNTARPWQPGNTVIFGHSSHLNIDSNKIGNTFKMLPLAEQGDKFYLVSKQGENYYTYAYQVNKKEIVDPQQVDVLRQDIKGNIATLITCYPIGTLDKRVVVEAVPITNIIDQTMIEMLNSLSV